MNTVLLFTLKHAAQPNLYFFNQNVLDIYTNKRLQVSELPSLKYELLFCTLHKYLKLNLGELWNHYRM